MNDKKDSGYLVPPMQAHMVLVLLFLLMAFDFIDRQVLAAVLPKIKEDWGISDTQGGALVSVVNVAIALLALPTAIVTDRWSRTKSIGIMALVWSSATGLCALAGNFWHMLAARFMVGAGEAGYVAGGNALISTFYPKRLRATVLGIFQSASMLGSVVGFVVGGYIATHWGWRHAFGVVAVPGLILAVLVFFVRDYTTVKVTKRDEVSGAMREVGVKEMLLNIFRSPVLLLIFVGQAAQLLFVSSVGNWMPSFFNRVHGLDLQQAGLRSGLILLISAAGVAACGFVIDRLSRGQSHRRLVGAAALSLITSALFITAFKTDNVALIFVGGFFMTSVLGPVMSAVVDFVHPGMRSSTSGAMITATNLLGMAIGPVASGALSDHFDLPTAMLVVSFSPLIAASCYFAASRLYSSRAVRSEDEPELAVRS